MRIKSDKGTTEVHFNDFAEVLPACNAVRRGYRQACVDKPDQKEKHSEAVNKWAARNFGQSTYMAAFDREAGSGGPIARLKKWDQWIADNPKQIKLYYDPAIVAACIMGEDE